MVMRQVTLHTSMTSTSTELLPRPRPTSAQGTGGLWPRDAQSQNAQHKCPKNVALSNRY